MRVPPSRHGSARPSAPPPQKGLESSSGIRQQAAGIAVLSPCAYHPQNGLESSSQKVFLLQESGSKQ